jgi:tight adherence protein C
MVGVRMPDIVLGHLRARRVKRMRDGFPDALDLLVVCVESGLGLAPAIERVSRELEISHADLAEDLAWVNAEIRAGVDRPVALRNLAARCGVPDIGGLVGLLIQTIRF